MAIEHGNKVPRLVHAAPLARVIMDKRPTDESNIISEWIRTEFALPKSVGAICDEYFLRIWTGSYVTESIQDGILYARSDNWIVHFQSTPEVVKSAKQVACSFRKYNGKNYVVIKVWTGGMNVE